MSIESVSGVSERVEAVENNLYFRLPPEADDHSLAIIVGDGYTLRAEKSLRSTETFYDTFDWRLFNKSLTLSRLGKEWVVRCLATGAALETLERVGPLNFGWEFEESPLQRRIESILKERRLFQIGKACIESIPYRVLNAESKTVAWLEHRRVSACTAVGALPFDAYLTLCAVRGYAGHFRRLSKLFGTAELTACTWQETFVQLLAAAGRQPGAYSAKPDYPLAPGTRADEATKIILRQITTVMRANEEGVKADWDTEFLHDYRTAIRRTRSALSQIPEVFSPEITAHYREVFGLLGERTNRLRDLDVYLLSESGYRAMLPDALRAHITPLFDHLQTQRGQALGEVTRYLQSTEYAALMAAWEAFLAEPVPDVPTAPNALLPIEELARRRIVRRYRQVIKDGNEVLAHAQEDELFHQLRIDCKKLRYVLEFFAGLFPKKEMDRLVNQLRGLQDGLGDFNDLSVQQVYLLQEAAALPAGNDAGKQALVAIGVLVEKLARAQEQLKPQLVQDFAEFAAAPNRALFHQLFKAKNKVASR